MVGVFYPAFAGNLTNGGTSGNISTASSSTPTEQPTLAPTKNPTLTPKPTPTHALKWTTIASFKGNGSKKTTVFTVPNNWKLVWSCVPSSFSGSYNLSVDVKGSDGSDVDLGAVNTICAAGNTGDSTQEYQGGAVYLDVQSEAVWSIQVQVLK